MDTAMKIWKSGGRIWGDDGEIPAPFASIAASHSPYSECLPINFNPKGLPGDWEDYEWISSNDHGATYHHVTIEWGSQFGSEHPYSRPAEPGDYVRAEANICIN